MEQTIILYNVVLIDPTSRRDNPRIVIQNIERFDKSIPLERDLENSALLFLFSTCKTWKKELKGIDLEYLELEDWQMYSQKVYCDTQADFYSLPLPSLIQN